MTISFTLPVGVGVALGSSISTEPKVRRAPFGDGYIQRSADGINSVRDQFTVLVNGCDVDQATAILAFMRARKAVESFLWTPPYEAQPRKFLCPKWERDYSDLETITVKLTLEEVFDP